MRYLTRDGIKLAWEDHGAGPPVLLLHGFSSSFRRNWLNTGWVDLFVRSGFRVAGLDLRGHGESSRPSDPALYAPHLLTGDIAALLDHLEIAQCCLVGFSMGAGLALRCALEQPARVASVVAGGAGDGAFTGEGSTGRLEAIIQGLTVRDPSLISAEIGRRFREFAARGDNDLQALAAFMQGRPAPPPPGSFGGPVLLVTAELDEWMSGSELVRRHFPQAEQIEIPGIRHIPLSADHRFKEAALQFLKRHSEAEQRPR